MNTSLDGVISLKDFINGFAVVFFVCCVCVMCTFAIRFICWLIKVLKFDV